MQRVSCVEHGRRPFQPSHLQPAIGVNGGAQRCACETDRSGRHDGGSRESPRCGPAAGADRVSTEESRECPPQSWRNSHKRAAREVHRAMVPRRRERQADAVHRRSRRSIDALMISGPPTPTTRDWFTLRRLELRLNLSHERLRPSSAPKGVTDANTSRHLTLFCEPDLPKGNPAEGQTHAIRTSRFLCLRGSLLWCHSHRTDVRFGAERGSFGR